MQKMPKSKTNSRRDRKRGFPPAESQQKSASGTTSQARPGKPPMRWGLVVLFLAISIGGCYLFLMMMPKAEFFTYEKLNEYDHDPNAFTQGLVIDGGFLWESTGRYGESSIRKVDLKTGEVIKKVDHGGKMFTHIPAQMAAAGPPLGPQMGQVNRD